MTPVGYPRHPCAHQNRPLRHVLIGTNLKYTKAHNLRIVLETIRLHGPLSRAEIARRTALTAQTITNITRKLRDQDLIRETHRLQEGRGAPATMLNIHSEGAFSIGLDLDTDHLTGVLVDLRGSVRRRIEFELNAPSPDEAVETLVRAAEDLLSYPALQRERVWGVGVGIPGPLDLSDVHVSTNSVSPKAFPGWKGVPLAQMLTGRLNLPIFLENNATAAAVGERWYGAGQHISTFFYVFLGLGLGGGLILNGQPYEGHTGNAGELGYFPTPGDADSDGQFGDSHLGVHFNVPRLYRLLRASGEEATSPSDLARLYEDANPCLLSWLDTAAQRLAPLVLAIEYVVDPEAIFFGGRLPECVIIGLMERLRQLLPGLRISGKLAAPSLRYATAGADAAVLGVATLPFFSSFAPTPHLLMKTVRTDDGAFAPDHPQV